MFKHATASVFLFAHRGGSWHIGLIHHPRLHRWMLPGGHLEPQENPAETALREVHEETGFTARLVATHVDGLTDAVAGVPVPVWIAEQAVPAEPRHPHPHIHVDYLYVAVASGRPRETPAELRTGWFSQADLGGLGMFDGSLRGAQLLFGRIDSLTAAANHETDLDRANVLHASDEYAEPPAIP